MIEFETVLVVIIAGLSAWVAVERARRERVHVELRRLRVEVPPLRATLESYTRMCAFWRQSRDHWRARALAAEREVIEQHRLVALRLSLSRREAVECPASQALHGQSPAHDKKPREPVARPTHDGTSSVVGHNSACVIGIDLARPGGDRTVEVLRVGDQVLAVRARDDCA